MSLATGVVDLTTGDRRAVCWTCGAHVIWDLSTPVVAAVEEYSVS